MIIIHPLKISKYLLNTFPGFSWKLLKYMLICQIICLLFSDEVAAYSAFAADCISTIQTRWGTDTLGKFSNMAYVKTSRRGPWPSFCGRIGSPLKGQRPRGRSISAKSLQ